MVQQLSTNTFTTAKWIVSPTASDGTHTTIASALTSASSGDTIFIRPGTFTENLSLKAGVNLAAYDCDALTPNVIISGTCTLTTAGTVSISGICLQTNSAPLLAVTGSVASIVNLKNCFLNCTNNDGITFSSSSSSALIRITECSTDLTTTGIKLFNHSSAGTLTIRKSVLSNNGGSSTASTVSAGTLILNHNQVQFPIITSGTGGLGCGWTDFDTSALNTTTLTLGGSGLIGINYSTISSGTASAVSISGTASLIDCGISSSNTNAITGAGTLVYNCLEFSGSSSTVNTSTQTPRQTGPKLYVNGGISFDAGSNLLANYAEGSFTPGISFGGGTTGITYTTQTGKYTRIGNVCFFAFSIVLSSKGSSTGAALITGFPFNSRTGSSIDISTLSSWSITTPSNYQIFIRPNADASTNFEIRATVSGGGSVAVTDTNFAATTFLTTVGFYFLT